MTTRTIHSPRLPSPSDPRSRNVRKTSPSLPKSQGKAAKSLVPALGASGIPVPMLWHHPKRVDVAGKSCSEHQDLVVWKHFPIVPGGNPLC